MGGAPLICCVHALGIVLAPYAAGVQHARSGQLPRSIVTNVQGMSVRVTNLEAAAGKEVRKVAAMCSMTAAGGSPRESAFSIPNEKEKRSHRSRHQRPE